MYEYQYLVGGALSLAVSAHVLVRKPRTLALKSLSLFGLVVLLWEISSFLSKGAPDSVTAANLFKVTVLTSHLCFPIYLFTVMHIREKRSGKVLLLSFAPAMIQLPLFFWDYFDNYEFFLTEFGWSYRVAEYQPSLLVVSIVFLGYLIGIIVSLLGLISKTTSPLLKRKYSILLVSFTFFQAIGTTLTNALIALGFLSPSSRVGGILQFLTFLFIWYALNLKEERVLVPLGGDSFSKVYSSFLTVLYNSASSSSLGEEFFKFSDFVRKSRIENHVLIAREKIAFEETEDLDLAILICRNLEILDGDGLDDEVVDSYLRVLKAADGRLGWRFEAVVRDNQVFLMKSDLMYGISEGRFLEKIANDESLSGLDDIDACLKIYKRILFQIVNKIQAGEFKNKLSENYVTGGLKTTDYGEISVNGVRDQLKSVPRDRCIPLIIERFNSVLSWAYETILADPNADIEKILGKLRLILTLNKDRAVELGVYPTLLGTLATKIPRTQVHRLYSDYLEELVEERTEELKKTQQELLKSQRLAAIGEVAAMVGHDLRNPLQSIVNMMYLTKQKLNSTSLQDSELPELAETVEEQVRYMNKIVSDLEDYARPLKVELAPTDLHKLINEILSNINVPDNVEVSEMIEDDLDFPNLMVDPALMKRVFINLITNALQAMPDGGHLGIVAKRTEDSALIGIQDTGIGIPEENMDKIFQPLFTTKAKGQGLGLAVCKRLVEAHGGSITAESKVGEGSTFTVRLPLQIYVKAPEIATRIP